MARSLVKTFFAQALIGLIFLAAAAAAQENANFAVSQNHDNSAQSVEAHNLKSIPAAGAAGGDKLITFRHALEQLLVRKNKKKEDLCDEKDAVASRILKDYGSVFLVIEQVLPPPVCIFSSSEDVNNFQRQIGIARTEIGGSFIELQPAAMEALLKARAEAQKSGLDITPRDGAIAGRRGFADTLRLWNSRFFRACDYWQKKGRLTEAQVARLKALPTREQVSEVLRLEQQGIYFNSAFNNSILYSVAAPGTSQHLALLAFDVVEYENKTVREILAKHGWFRTVRNDQPHFTFLGHKESELKRLGLKEVVSGGGKFWIPNI